LGTASRPPTSFLKTAFAALIGGLLVNDHQPPTRPIRIANRPSKGLPVPLS